MFLSANTNKQNIKRVLLNRKVEICGSASEYFLTLTLSFRTFDSIKVSEVKIFFYILILPLNLMKFHNQTKRVVFVTHVFWSTF